jgi:hypothetical protein
VVIASWGAVPAAAPVLRSADISVTLVSPGECGVVMSLRVDDGDRVEHRLAIVGETHVDRVAIVGATEVEPARDIGRTRALVLRPERPTYELRYRVVRVRSLEGRCPLWLPAVPADGVSRGVRLRVDLPAGAVAGGSMPALRWDGGRGTTAMGHMPSFVRVNVGYDGVAPAWDLGIVMDGLTLAAFAGGSLAWLWRRKRS